MENPQWVKLYPEFAHLVCIIPYLFLLARDIRQKHTFSRTNDNSCSMVVYLDLRPAKPHRWLPYESLTLLPSCCLQIFRPSRYPQHRPGTQRQWPDPTEFSPLWKTQEAKMNMKGTNFYGTICFLVCLKNQLQKSERLFSLKTDWSGEKSEILEHCCIHLEVQRPHIKIERPQLNVHEYPSYKLTLFLFDTETVIHLDNIVVSNYLT